MVWDEGEWVRAGQMVSDQFIKDNIIIGFVQLVRDQTGSRRLVVLRACVRPWRKRNRFQRQYNQFLFPILCQFTKKRYWNI